jgi:glycosyltransferase involved in cell wall biosynthesis
MNSGWKMKVFMLGLRGFPDVQGGVETHCENLCPELVRQNCEITVITRSPYVNHNDFEEWKGVSLKQLWAPRSKGLEAILHTFLGVLYAAVKRPDIVHIQAIGPAIWTLFARMLRLHVVVTHHGPDYDRQKWGRFAKFTLRTGERLGMKFSNGRIVISETIYNIVKDKYGVNSVRIPNGVVLPELNAREELVETFGLVPGQYVLLVSRLVKEKRHLDLISAFNKSGLNDWKLVLVGDSDHPDSYVKEVHEAAAKTEDVVMTGYQSGESLKALYQHAGIFVLPSSHEGLPIALLEALSFGLTVVASDIAANKEIGLNSEHYFKLGDTDELAKRLQYWSEKELLIDQEREKRREWVKKHYDWQQIAHDTYNLYQNVIGK